MARLARFVIPGIPHHVTQRGNGRQQAFFCDDDYALYRDLLRAHAAASGVAVWSWVLMPNHVHLILVPETEDSLRACLSKVHRAYAGHIHAREKRTGLRCFIDPPDQWRARSGKGALAVWRWMKHM
jgi:putative transposase